ncbi:hypothetical protein J0S82_015853 [Galemys pyrenaicus]|uniref:Uncharacterized protein n=1 Tax=Galemys pyrenaicus TaxID=202257 RepID=A0A8J6AIC8_GALPY|nr:hypothetical protein J0S82_015853 [Galemys pyrenaicus]
MGGVIKTPGPTRPTNRTNSTDQREQLQQQQQQQQQREREESSREAQGHRGRCPPRDLSEWQGPVPSPKSTPTLSPLWGCNPQTTTGQETPVSPLGGGAWNPASGRFLSGWRRGRLRRRRGGAGGVRQAGLRLLGPLGRTRWRKPRFVWPQTFWWRVRDDVAPAFGRKAISGPPQPSPACLLARLPPQ